MAGWAEHERAAFLEAVRAVDADAPTLCAGWTVRDLVAHVYVREHRPDAALGVLPLGPLTAYTDRVMASALRVQGFAGLVERIAAPPPVLRVGRLDDVVNTIEFFVHTEDVRRPNHLPPRALPAGLERVLWHRLTRLGRLAFRRAGARVRLVPTTGESPHEVGAGEPVELRGRPSELLLYAYNRKALAEVEVSGDPMGIERVRQARLGL